MAKLDPVAGTFNSGAVLRGTLTSLALTFVLSLAGGMVYFFTSLPEQTMPFLSAGVILLSATAGAFVASRRAGGKGLYHGLAVGLATFVLLWVAALFLSPAEASLQGILEKLSLSVLGGLVGGFAGVTFLP
ncbi:MAG TPA: TIGR04086 family membrane protein [Spirochaetia bacterium]|nr:TIGR04086 family membrane protein [Spirochaetia bacterium]